MSVNKIIEQNQTMTIQQDTLTETDNHPVSVYQSWLVLYASQTEQL